MSQENQNICLVLLIGIPGSGKSYFSNFVESYFKKNGNTVLGRVTVIPVCYDDYIKVRTTNVANDSDFSQRWKEERAKVFRNVETIVNSFKEHGSLQNNCDTVTPVIENRSTSCVLIVIDDNMYYRSMRYEYYQLAKKFGLSFCQFYFKVELEVGLKHNGERTEEFRVPDYIVKQMFEKMESPRVTNNWELYSKAINLFPDYSEKFNLDEICDTILNALKHPVESCADSKMEKDKMRTITNGNICHQADNILRKLIGENIQQAVHSGVGHNQIKELSRQYSDKKQEILRRLKNDEIVLPFDNGQNITNEHLPIITSFLSTLLQLVKIQE